MEYSPSAILNFPILYSLLVEYKPIKHAMVCHQAQKHENVILLVGQIPHSELTHKTCWNSHMYTCIHAEVGVTCSMMLKTLVF